MERSSTRIPNLSMIEGMQYIGRRRNGGRDGERHARVIVSLETTVKRRGTVLRPDGAPAEVEGILNPASARTREGKLLLYPRMVAQGNRSRIGIVEVDGSAAQRVYRRIGFALEPSAPYELRESGGFGCEDARVTFIPALDR